jgi:hypothetical protein
MPGIERAEHLQEIAERVIAIVLESLGIAVPKDFFRARRSPGG